MSELKTVWNSFTGWMKDTIAYAWLSIRMMWECKRGWLIVYLFVLFLVPFGALANNYIRRGLIDSLLGFISSTVPENKVFLYIALTVGLAITMSLCNSLQSYFSNLISMQTTEDVQRKGLQKAIRLQQKIFDSNQEFDKIRDLLLFERFSIWPISEKTLRIVTSLIGLIGSILIIFAYHPLLVLFAVLAVLPTLFVQTLAGEWDYLADKELWRTGWVRKYYGNVMMNRQIAKELRAFACAGRILELWRKCNDTLLAVAQKNLKKVNKWNILTSIVTTASYGLLYGYIAYEAWQGRITPGYFLFYAGTYQVLHSSLQDISSNLNQISYRTWLFGEYNNFVKLSAEERSGGKDAGSLKKSQGIELSFDKVSFRYDGMQRDLLSELSFNIAPHEKIAIVGLNGAGKSTLIRLLSGLYSPNKGNILYNGEDAQQFAHKDIYPLFGTVFQDYCKYQISLRDNLGLCNLSKSSDDSTLMQAARMGGIEQIMHKFPRGLDTMLGRELDDDGVDLSGGEWQKLALSRAYFCKRPILIFDEPTSALDPYSEYMLMDNAINQNPDSTVIVISHRLAVATLADRVLFLHDGKIKEQGSHEELMAQNGMYAEMFRLQAAKYQLNDFIKKQPEVVGL